MTKITNFFEAKQTRASFSEAQNVFEFEQDLMKHDFYQDYSLVYRICQVLLIVGHIGAAYCSYSFLVVLMSVKIHFAWFFASVALLLLEVLKHSTLRVFFVGFFHVKNKRSDFFMLSIGLICLAGSVYMCVQGGEAIATDPIKIASIGSRYDSLIAMNEGKKGTVATDFKEQKKVKTFQGVQVVSNLSEAGAREIQLINQETERLRNEKNRAIQAERTIQNNTQNGVQWLFGVLDCMIVFAMAFIYFFRKNAVIEKNFDNVSTEPVTQNVTHNVPTEPTTQNVTPKGQQAIFKDAVSYNIIPDSKIKCHYGSCNTVFTPKRKNHRFCSNACRMAYYNVTPQAISNFNKKK